MVSWEAAKDALAHSENGSVLGSISCTDAAAAIVWCVASYVSPSVTAPPPPVFDQLWRVEGCNSEVIPVGSLVSQVTAGSRVMDGF